MFSCNFKALIYAIHMRRREEGRRYIHILLNMRRREDTGRGGKGDIYIYTHEEE